MKELVNTTIHEIRIQLPEGHFVQFIVDNHSSITYRAEGDCCSETWIYAICGIDILIDEKILEVIEVEMPIPNDDKTRQECDELYCYRLRTKRGICDIEFRNSSNGYYGGSLEFVSSYDLVDPVDPDIPVEFKTIIKDFVN